MDHCKNPIEQVHFQMVQGDTYRHHVDWVQTDGSPVDLTDYTARLHARPRVNSSDLLFEVTETDGITLGGQAGTIDISIDGAKTTMVTRNAVYDLEMTSPAGLVTTIMAGDICLFPDVTR